MSSYYLENITEYVCTYCDFRKNFILLNGQCVCRPGYFINYTI